MRTTSWRALVLTIRVCAFAAVVAGASSIASGAPTAVAASARPTANAPKPATAAQWARVVAAAKREGAVTIYSSQSPFNLAAFGERFKQKYGITVTINRNKEGQAIVHRHLGTALAGVPNTTQIVPRKQNLKESTPEKVAAFQRYWDSLFRK